MRVMFLGGPGNISDSTIACFLKKEYPVAVIKRSHGGLMGYEGKIKVYYGDRDKKEVLTGAFRDFEPDIVIDSTCFEIPQADTVVSALREVPCKRFLFISTADVYGYPLSRLPMGEEDPKNPPNGKYAEDKLAIEEFYRSRLKTTPIGYTIIRPGYSLGKTFCMSAFGRDRGVWLVDRIRRGEPVYSPGDGTTLIDAGAAYNTGRMIARICEDDSTIGEIYNCVHNRAVTYDEYLQAFADALGKPVKIVHIPTDFLFSLDRQEVKESVLGDLARFHLYFSAEKFQKKFPDFEWEYSLADAIREFIAYQESVGGFAGAEKPVFEDRIMKLWQEEMEQLKQRIATKSLRNED